MISTTLADLVFYFLIYGKLAEGELNFTATYDWPLAKIYDNYKLRELITGKEATALGDKNFLHTTLGVFTRERTGYINLGSTPLECLGNLDLCENGLSVSFWMNFKVSFVSNILGMNSKYQNALREWLDPLVPANTHWFLCYRASDRGLETKTFHKNCDGSEERGPTVTLVKVGRFIFGGFSDQSWGGPSNQYLSSRRAFLFSIVNPVGLDPIKLNVRPEKFDKALKNVNEAGPVFGEDDLFIGNHIDGSAVSFSDLGHAYELPNKSFQVGSLDARTFLAGSYKFVPDNVEVFYYHVDKQVITPTDATSSATFVDDRMAPHEARPNSPSGWCAFEENVDQWLAIDLSSPQAINKIELVKNDGDEKYVTAYTISYSGDGQSWTTYNNKEEFSWNASALVKIPSARFVRFHPLTWNAEICMRVRIFKGEDSIHFTDLGVGNLSVIPTNHFEASSWACMSPPSFSKGIPEGKCHSAWCGQGPNTSNWLQIKLGSSPEFISHLATKGSNLGHMVTSFYLAYGIDGNTWQNYTVGGERQLLFSGSGEAEDWIGHHILQPFKAIYLRIIPHECSEICCMAVKVYKHVYAQEGSRTNFIISSGGLGVEGLNLYQSYNTETNRTSYELSLATTTKLWSLTVQRIPVIPFGWVYVCITWSEAWGLRYYENGLLIKTQLTFEGERRSHNQNQALVGRSTSVSVSWTQFHLQMSELMFWYNVLSEAAVKETLKLTDVNRIWLPETEQPDMDLKWQQSTSCTSTNDTVPCQGRTKNFVYIESSFPHVKGDKARLISRVTVPVRNCFTFWYFMHGKTTGRLNVYLREKSFNNLGETLVWRLAGSRGDEWKKGEIPIKVDNAYEIIVEGVIGGYHGHIAISDAALTINENCSFAPNEATPYAHGVQSGMIGHVASYVMPFYSWLAQAGFSNSRWVPCYRAANHGWSSKAFHEMCQQDAPSIVLVRKNSFVFGGFSDISWKLEGCENKNALGMQNGVIPDSRITASTESSEVHAAPRSRLHITGNGSLKAAWVASTLDENQWLQVDIGHPLNVVTAVATQGRGDHPRWVKTYKLQYSNDEVIYQFYMEQGATESKIFTGNTDRHTVICNKLRPPIKARYIRFRPLTWNKKIAMRVELYGFKGGSFVTRPSSKAFLFSLRGFYESFSNTRLDIKPLERHLAVTVDYDVLKFGNGDLTVYLNNGSIEAEIGNVYQAPTVTESSKFFAGERHFLGDDLEVLIPSDSVCEPPCFQGQFCDEITGQCLCNSELRDEEWCRQSSINPSLALGMQSGAITDEQISSSSQFDGYHASRYGRLHLKESPNNKGGWSAHILDNNQWLQIDLGNHRIGVNKVATQGRSEWNQWVTEYKLQYSDDGVTFNYYKEQGQPKEFIANTDQASVVHHEINPPIIARYIRFQPIAWHEHISMRVELYGFHECQKALGMEANTITDDQIRASSEWGGTLVATLGRLNSIRSWSSRTNDVNQWLQIYLQRYTKITKVSTQGRADFGQWVTKYKLQFGNDGVNFQYYKQQGEQKEDKIFDGNTDQEGVVSHELNPSMWARFIRFRPVTWKRHVSMRVELFGCSKGVRVIDEVTKSAAFYWTMDSHRDVKNIAGADWGHPANNSVTIKGIRGDAVYIGEGANGAFTLSKGLANSCLFDPSLCSGGFTLMLWLRYKHKTKGSQVFLTSNSENNRGHKMYQIVGDTPQVAFEITTTNRKCVFGFVSPKEIWTHYVLTYSTLADPDNVQVFVQGIEVTDFVVKDCIGGNFPAEEVGEFTIGRQVNDANLPEAAFDELIIWYKNLSRDDVATFFTYYKGGPNLQLHANLSFTDITWTESLLDPESVEFITNTDMVTNDIKMVANSSADVIVHRYWPIELPGSAFSSIGCELTVKFGETGYEAAEPIVEWLEASPRQAHYIEANDIYVTAVRLQAVNHSKETAINVTITWRGPMQLPHGVFQGYQIFYQDTRLGHDFNVTLRTSDLFYEIQDLRPYTKYKITARSMTLEGEGRLSDSIFIWTAASAPSVPPTSITAYNLTSTSLRVTWTKIPGSQVLGEIKGYSVVFYAARDGDSNPEVVTLESGTVNETVLDDLEKFTNYSVQVLGFTERDKIGPPSSPVYVMTDQDVPLLAPSYVTARGTGTSTIVVNWGPVPEQGTNGIIISYSVAYRKQNDPTGWKNVSCSTSLWCELKNLDFGTRYSIHVAGKTIKGIGPSAHAKADTEKAVPGPPTRIHGYNTSSTGINISWDLVPPNVRYESVHAYEITITTNTSLGKELVVKVIKAACASVNSMSLQQTRLKKFTPYAVTIAGVTRKGLTNITEGITILTDEDVPEGSPQNITPLATSAKSVTLAWKPMTSDIANGLILGYHIILFDKLRNTTRNITVQSLDQAVIENLLPYTEYEARLVPFNSKGFANVSQVISVRTQEAAPSRPPSNVTSESPSSSSVSVSWKAVDIRFINGVLRAYMIVFFESQSPEDTRQNITIPVTSGRRRRDINGRSSQSFELTGLKKFTSYTIQVLAYTVDYGVPSQEINITTAQDVPTHPPVNITSYNTSSTSINVTWQPIPADHVNGILLGYRIFYRKSREDKPVDSFRNVTLNSSSLDVEITGLEFFTKYEIRLLGFTIVGEGNISEALFCLTDESAPESAPVSVRTLPADATALQVSWLPVTEEKRNGVILGYRVALVNKSGEPVRNVTVLGGETLSITFGRLEIWTNYSVQICAFNGKGHGPWSTAVVGNTDEEAPRVAPANVTAFNTSSTSIYVTWQPISTVGLNGILRGYRVYYIERETFFTRFLRNVTINSMTLEAELVGLYKFTQYSVYVTARTTRDGVMSERVNVSTDEDTPDRAPGEMNAWTPRSTELHVTWKDVPDAYKNGIIKGFKMHYTEIAENGPSVIMEIPPVQRSLTITGLKKFTLYNVTILAFTRKGDGVSTSKMLLTDQDVPEVAPLHVEAENWWTTHTIPIKWSPIPAQLLNGILTGYRIRYQAVELGLCPHREDSKEVVLPAENTSTVLTGLENFAMYRIEITGLTMKGDGPSEVIFAETCRCEKRLTTNWIPLDPYVTDKNNTDPVAGGLLTPFVNDMAVTCCQSCKTHGKSFLDFELNGEGGPSIQSTEQAFKGKIDHATDFSFPVYGYKLQETFRKEFRYTGIIESPGIAYVINTNHGHHISSSLVNSVLESWPLFVVSTLLTYLVGFAIWATDQTRNNEHFPRSFFSGVWEGFWCAYVSMTTVGYGDRLPLSFIARLLAIVWTVTGVVVISILVSAISVSLTGETIGLDHNLYGAKIAAIHGSPEHHLGLRRNAKFDQDKIHHNFEEIYELLSSNQIGGVLIDGYVVGTKKHLFEKPFLRIYKIYDYSSVYGVVTGGDSRKLAKCFHSYMQENIAKIFHHVAKNVEAIEVSPEPLEVERSSGLFDPSSELFKKNLMILGAMLCCGILAGTFWEVLYRIRLKMKISPQKNKAFPISAMRGMVDDFNNRMNSVVLELKEKHNRQKQLMLALKKNDHSRRYERTGTDSAIDQDTVGGSSDYKDLSAGIAARRSIFEAENINKNLKNKASFNTVDEEEC